MNAVISCLGAVIMVGGVIYGRVAGFRSFEERLNASVRKDYKEPTAKQKAWFIGLMLVGLILFLCGLGA